MEISWKNKRTKTLFHSKERLRKKGLDQKEIRHLFMAMNFIKKVDSINKLPNNLRCHPIKEGKKFLYYAIDLPSVGGGKGKNRIALVPKGDYDRSDIKTITSVKILGIIDYH